MCNETLSQNKTKGPKPKELGSQKHFLRRKTNATMKTPTNGAEVIHLEQDIAGRAPREVLNTQGHARRVLEISDVS